MQNKLVENQGFHFTWLRLLIIILLVLGVFFRFVNLDRKPYWFDESYTSIRISGYRAAEVRQQLFDGRVIGVKDLQKYQRTNPERGLIDTINSLKIEDPQHPPLYYVMVRFWVQWFGDSVAVTRSLSALISLFAFPCVYWLCLELFESSLVGWVAIALIAVSPLHVLYAQEAREYALFIVSILLSSAALLQAIRLKTNLSWGMYATTVALGFYTFPFYVFVATGHAIYVVAIESFRLSKTVTAYLLASLAGLLSFTPWLWIIMTNLSKIQSATSWAVDKVPLLFLVKLWCQNISYVFLDVQPSYTTSQFGFNNPLTYILITVTLILVGYSIYFVCRHTPKRVWLFILTLIGVTALALILPDLILGGQRSGVGRYLMPCYLGIELAVAYLLATQMTSIAAKLWRQKLWQLVAIALLSGGILSCVLFSQAETWRSKLTNYYDPHVAGIINQSTQPLLVSDDALGNILSVSHLLNLNVRLQLVVKPKIPKIPDGFSNVFLYKPSDRLRAQLEKDKNDKIVPVFNTGYVWLWRLEK